jgi:hypothetical protein
MAHRRPKSEPGYALFYNDSRFGRFRDPSEAPYWRVKLAKAGWVVRFCINDDTENTTARHIIRAVGEAQASEYLENLRRNARAGTRGAAALGLWQNEAPFGYRRLATAPERDSVVLAIGQRKSDDQTVRLTPDPDGEAEIGSRRGTLTKRILEPLVIEEIARAVSGPEVQKAIRDEVDRWVAELRGGGEQPMRDARKEERDAESARERLVRSIRDGLVTEAEARSAMEEVRERVRSAQQEVARLEHADVAARDLEAERERLIALAADFPARARAATGVELRELIEPWIESATFDKDTRELVLALRVVPSVQASYPSPAASIERRRRITQVPWNRRLETSPRSRR